MALSPSELHRLDQLRLRSALFQETLRVWPALNPRHLDTSFEVWGRLIEPLLARYRAQSVLVARRYVTTARSEVGLPGRPAVRALPPPLTFDQIRGTLIATGVGPVRKALLANKPRREALNRGFVASSGAIAKLAMDGGRNVILQTARVDPDCRGWFRESPPGCEFCAWEAGQGVTTRTKFRAHGSCACQPGLAYPKTPIPEFVQEMQTQRHVSGSFAKFRADYKRPVSTP